MDFLIRSDDHGWTSGEIPGSHMKVPEKNCELSRRFHEAMDGVPYLAGFIPAALDQFGAEWVRSRPEGMSVALHGYSHDLGENDTRDEMFGRSVNSIRDRIGHGQTIVGLTPFYIPPFNGISENLAEAAWHEGIRHIFSGPVDWPTPPSPVEIARGVKMWPAWGCIYGSLAWEQGCPPILKTLPSLLSQPGKAVLTLHLTWLAARDPKFTHVKEFADMIRGHAISAEEFTK